MLQKLPALLQSTTPTQASGRSVQHFVLCILIRWLQSALIPLVMMQSVAEKRQVLSPPHEPNGERAQHTQGLTEAQLSIFIVFCILCYLWLLSGCAIAAAAHTDAAYQSVTQAELRWRPLSSGIEAADIHDLQRSLIVHVVKIDLSDPSVSVVTSEPALFQNNRGCIRGETTRDFALRHNTIVAFNAAPFTTASLFFSMHRTIIGIHITDFQRMSMPNERYGALLFYADQTARIIDSQTEEALSADVRHAVGGFWTILRSGRIVPQKNQRRDTRTAVGLADNGKTLLAVVVEGANKRNNHALSFEETAVLMQNLGVDDALQLDGGSSSSLILQENGKQHIAAPMSCWNIHIRVASNIGIISK